MILKDGTRVRKLPDRFGTGYAGFGYGGDRLYVVCLVDCFDPPRYLVRADSFSQACEIAQECLSETVEDDQYFAGDYGFQYSDIAGRLDAGLEIAWLTFSESGRLVSADDDIQVRQIAGPRDDR